MADRFEGNVPGPFYIEADCCTACGVMHDVAPDIVSWQALPLDERGYQAHHCFVSRQPETEADAAQIFAAMKAMDMDCLRYGGNDPTWLKRLAAAGFTDQCDEPLFKSEA